MSTASSPHRHLIVTSSSPRRAKQVCERLQAEWARQGIADDLDGRAEAAWTWWQANKGGYTDTKVWRIIDSLAGKSSGSVAG